MEVLVQTIPKITEERGYHIMFIDINGDEYELENITFGSKAHNYKFSGNINFLHNTLVYYGECNILIPQDDGTIGRFRRNILSDGLTGKWILIDDEELNNSFDEV